MPLRMFDALVLTQLALMHHTNQIHSKLMTLGT
jgi:hypothetical protein